MKVVAASVAGVAVIADLVENEITTPGVAFTVADKAFMLEIGR